MYRKKKYLILVLLFIVIACSSDDKGDVKDPIFEAEYTPLNSLEELRGTYFYKGSKIGNRSFGEISGKNCAVNNSMNFGIPNKENENNRFFTFTSYKASEQTINLCARDFTRTISNVELKSLGKLRANISDIIINVSDFSFINGMIQNEDGQDDEVKEEFEIGIQAGYLRIEDKFSRNTLKEKSYLYFKKG